jgi:hypothetical protein
MDGANNTWMDRFGFNRATHVLALSLGTTRFARYWVGSRGSAAVFPSAVCSALFATRYIRRLLLLDSANHYSGLFSLETQISTYVAIKFSTHAVNY